MVRVKRSSIGRPARPGCKKKNDYIFTDDIPCSPTATSSMRASYALCGVGRSCLVPSRGLGE